MNFETLLNKLTANTLDVSLPGFMPELVLCATIVLMLLLRLPWGGRLLDAIFLAPAAALAARLASWVPSLYFGWPSNAVSFTAIVAASVCAIAAVFIVFRYSSRRGAEFVAYFVGLTAILSLLWFGWRITALFVARELAIVAAYLVIRYARRFHAACVALPGTLIALYFAAPWTFLSGSGVLPRTEIFTGLLVYDTLTVYFRSLLLVFAVLFFVFTWLSGIPDREDSADFYTLVLGGTLGMCLMASANHLFMVFLAIEMASVPSYALAGMLKGRRKSSEAALKYSIYGAGTAGVMLYGISLLGGSLGSLHLPTIASQLAHMSPDFLDERQSVLMLGGLMLMVGIAFKLSAVPFHFWCPDVFEGASAEVNAFLSVASKAAALALLVRVAVGFGALNEPAAPNGADATAPVITVAAPVASDAPTPAEHAVVAAHASKSGTMARARHYIVGLIALLAAITCTFGNLTAYAQTNIKRLLAYSTIAHAGYMMMPVAAAVAMMSDRPDAAQQAIGGLCFYVGIYLFMNLSAFAVVAFLRNAMRSEEISSYAGLINRCPGLVIWFSVILFSLVGLPPLAGFAAKFLIFAPLAVDPLRYPLLLTLLVIGGINTVISLFYYLRIVKVMALDPEPEDRLPVSFPLTSPEGVFIVLISIPVLLLGVWWDPLNRLAQEAAKSLLS